MPILTRANIRQHAAAYNQETLGQPGGESTVLYDSLIDVAAGEIARLTDCYFGKRMADVVASQPDYTPSDIYSYTNVFWIDTTGIRYRLFETSNEELDQNDMASVGGASIWRNISVGNPQYFCRNDENSIRLYPTPQSSSFVYTYSDLAIQSSVYQITSSARPFVSGDVGSILRISAGTGFTVGIYNILSVSSGIATVDNPLGTASSTSGSAILSTGGLYVEGHAVPGNTWSNATDNCPLPERAQESLCWRVAVLRCMQLPGPGPLMRLPMLKAEYASQLKMLQAEQFRATSSTRHADHQRRRRRWY